MNKNIFLSVMVSVLISFGSMSLSFAQNVPVASVESKAKAAAKKGSVKPGKPHRHHKKGSKETHIKPRKAYKKVK